MIRLMMARRGVIAIGLIWGFPKVRGTILGVLTIGMVVFWGLYWGPLILGNYHVSSYIAAVYSAARHPKPYT